MEELYTYTPHSPMTEARLVCARRFLWRTSDFAMRSRPQHVTARAASQTEVTFRWNLVMRGPPQKATIPLDVHIAFGKGRPSGRVSVMRLHICSCIHFA